MEIHETAEKVQQEGSDWPFIENVEKKFVFKYKFNFKNYWIPQDSNSMVVSFVVFLIRICLFGFLPVL